MVGGPAVLKKGGRTRFLQGELGGKMPGRV